MLDCCTAAQMGQISQLHSIACARRAFPDVFIWAAHYAAGCEGPRVHIACCVNVLPVFVRTYATTMRVAKDRNLNKHLSVGLLGRLFSITHVK